jgi:hypothetical protein
MSNATETTVTSRAFGKCRRKGCKGRKVLEIQRPEGVKEQAFDALRRYPNNRCPVCGHFSLEVSMVRATISETTPCRQACTDAMTPNCKCSCGGAHHGENVADYDKWSGS